jgi:large subunit ribosomal protein L5
MAEKETKKPKSQPQKAQPAAKAEKSVKAAKAEKAPKVEYPVPRLKVRYKEEILPALMKEFGFDNPMQAPRLSKVCINMGVGKAIQDSKALEHAVRDLSEITGQKAVITRAKKSIAAFRVREKMPIACRVTLRGDRMFEFLDRLFTIVMPRVRDFRGLSPDSVDGHGNYTLGLKEQTLFPELNLDKIEKTQGMDITIVTTAKSDEEALGLLRHLGLPLRAV